MVPWTRGAGVEGERSGGFWTCFDWQKFQMAVDGEKGRNQGRLQGIWPQQLQGEPRYLSREDWGVGRFGVDRSSFWEMLSLKSF